MIVECRQLVKVYQEDHISVTAVNKIDLNVDEGEFLSLSGPSGSGKTTLLNLIGGLDKASQGEINLAGQRIDQMDRSKLADLRLAKIGFVFQAYNLLPVLSALENVEFIMLLNFPVDNNNGWLLPVPLYPNLLSSLQMNQRPILTLLIPMTCLT